jgi:MFS family permease
MALLLAAGILNQVDRQVLAMLIEPIKAELKTSDTRWACSPAFTSCSSTCRFDPGGAPCGSWQPSYRDRGCVRVWSAATIACGMARSYTQLALARVMVAFGQGGVSPGVLSQLGEILSPGVRTRVFGIFASSSSMRLGILLGCTLQHAPGWRQVFVVVGLPGLILAPLIFLTLPETRDSGERGTRQARAVSDQFESGGIPKVLEI